MSNLELQEEEREVLMSIYDGDDNFKQISPTTFQYKYGETDTLKTFLLELKWGENYPNEKPVINTDMFYNKHILETVRKNIEKHVSNEAEQYLGMSMTYTLFEFLKEKFEDFIAEQPEKAAEHIEKLQITQTQDPPKKEPKKEQLTKGQKRRQWNRLDGTGERPRGWNWVDIVKHLSQTGSRKDSTPTS